MVSYVGTKALAAAAGMFGGDNLPPVTAADVLGRSPIGESAFIKDAEFRVAGVDCSFDGAHWNANTNIHRTREEALNKLQEDTQTMVDAGEIQADTKGTVAWGCSSGHIDMNGQIEVNVDIPKNFAGAANPTPAVAALTQATGAVYFGHDLANLTPDDIQAIQDFVNANPEQNQKIYIFSSADPSGTETHNVGLTDQRSAAIKEVFKTFGYNNVEIIASPGEELSAKLLGSDRARDASMRFTAFSTDRGTFGIIDENGELNMSQIENWPQIQEGLTFQSNLDVTSGDPAPNR